MRFICGARKPRVEKGQERDSDALTSMSASNLHFRNCNSQGTDGEHDEHCTQGRFAADAFISERHRETRWIMDAMRGGIEWV
mgnify:CR=1 FL=1